MPGTCLWLSASRDTKEMLPRFRRAQDAMLHGPDYRSHVLVARGGCLLGTTGYPDYPARTVERQGHVVMLEGRVYNKSRSEAESQLVALAKLVFETDEDVSRVVRDWVVSADGDFVVAMVSADGRQLAVISDYLGRLPIYLHIGEVGLVIGRECKFIALISGDARFDRLGWAQHLWLGYPLGRRTLFEGIDRAPGGLFMRARIRGGSIETTCTEMWVLNLDEKEDSQPSAREFGAVAADRVRRVVADRARAHKDVPNVLSLSGGHDSRMVASALCSEVPHLASAGQGRPDAKSRADARIAARVAACLNIPWTLVPLAISSADEEELVWLKDGLNNVGVAFMVPYLRAIRERWGVGTAYWTGDGGDKIFPDLRPRAAVSSEDVLVNSLVAQHALMHAGVAEAITELPKGSLLEDLRSHVQEYPEKDLRQKAVHYAIYERGRKWLFEGEDRNRFFLWQVSPFYAASLLPWIMRVPDELKVNYRFYREVQLALRPAITRIAHAQLGVAIGSVFFPWKLKMDAAVRRMLPRSLKSGLKRVTGRGEWTANRGSGRRVEWAKLAAEAIRRGLPMAASPMMSFVQRASASQFDFWRTLVLLESLRSKSNYSGERCRAASN